MRVASALCALTVMISGAASATGTPATSADVPAVPAWVRKIPGFVALPVRPDRDVGPGPSIIGGKILTSTIRVGEEPQQPSIRLRYAAPNGLYEVVIPFISPSRRNYYGFAVSSGINIVRTQAQGNRVFEQPGQPMSLFSEQGVWKLDQIYMLDDQNLTVTYNAAQLASLFPSVTMNVVNKDKPDKTPPSFSTGTILTPVLAQRHEFMATLNASDAISGVNQLTIYYNKPNGQVVNSVTMPTAPVYGGPINIGIDVGVALGTWKIIGLQLRDNAGLYTGDYSAADIQAAFGTDTFVVTK